MNEIKVKYLADIEPISPIVNGDWIDLRAAETVQMRAFEFRKIPLGIAMQLPNGYEAIIAPRSSTFERYQIIMTNGIGIIDESYCGNDDEWRFPALAINDTVIHKGDRIAQFRLLWHQQNMEFVTVDELGNRNRGGFGSTGR